MFPICLLSVNVPFENAPPIKSKLFELGWFTYVKCHTINLL